MLDNIVSAIFNNLKELLPLVIVHDYERGCRWSFGKKAEALEPGLHWRLYFYHDVLVLPVVDDVVNLPIQSVITADEKLVCFQVSFGYRVTDIVKHCCNVTDFHESTVAIAKRHLAKRVREMKLSDLVADLTKLERSLEGTLTTQFRDWGTEVFAVGFTDFAEVPTQMRIFGGTTVVPVSAVHA